ncbi:MAG: cyclase family protein [Alcanivoracaceae bacterium]|nr:cyclase family protein [Alcanivoracaceae bacterium]
MNKKLIVLCSLIISTFCFAENLFKGKWIDLSYNFSEETIYWPTADNFKKTTVFEGHNDKGFYYSAYNYTAAEHGGTHLDAPVHFSEGKNTVDDIPLDQLIGSGIVIRVLEKTKKDRNYQITVADILSWEKQHGIIEDGSIVLFDTGSAQYWPDKKKYMGTAERGADAVAKLKFPGLHPKAAEFLATQRSIKAVGLDTPSIDFGGSTHFESHQILFKQNIFGIENITNLNALPEIGFMVVALPMKIKDGSGGPLRVVAFIPEK